MSRELDVATNAGDRECPIMHSTAAIKRDELRVADVPPLPCGLLFVCVVASPSEAPRCLMAAPALYTLYFIPHTLYFGFWIFSQLYF